MNSNLLYFKNDHRISEPNLGFSNSCGISDSHSFEPLDTNENWKEKFTKSTGAIEDKSYIRMNTEAVSVDFALQPLKIASLVTDKDYENHYETIKDNQRFDQVQALEKQESDENRLPIVENSVASHGDSKESSNEDETQYPDDFVIVDSDSDDLRSVADDF